MTVDQRLHLRPNGYKQTNAHRHKWRTSHLWSFSNPFLLECLRRIELDMFMCFTDWRRYLTECFSDSLSFPVSPLKGVNVLPLFYWAGFSQSLSLSLSVPLTPFLCLSPCVFHSELWNSGSCLFQFSLPISRKLTSHVIVPWESKMIPHTHMHIHTPKQ